MSDITFLFDLDGTLVDTDALHLNAYNTLLARWQRAIDLDYYKTHMMGFPDDMIFGGLFPGMPAAEFTELAAEKERLFRAQLGARLTPTAGTEALLNRIARAGLRSAVVTNAPRENARMMLEALGLGERFETLVIGGELAHGKPHPLPYLTALNRSAATRRTRWPSRIRPRACARPVPPASTPSACAPRSTTRNCARPALTKRSAISRTRDWRPGSRGQASEASHEHPPGMPGRGRRFRQPAQASSAGFDWRPWLAGWPGCRRRLSARREQAGRHQLPAGSTAAPRDSSRPRSTPRWQCASSSQ